MPAVVGTLGPLIGWPVHRKHLFLWPDEFFRAAMTIETPFHIERRNLISQRHEVNAPVTRRAPHTLVNVNAVIEISEVGEVVHPGPLDRLSGAPAFAYRLEVRALSPDL